MRHGVRFWLAVSAAVVVGLPLLLVAIALAALNTGPGQRFAQGLAGKMTGGTVVLTGLHGRVPDALRIDRLELRDARGTWLAARGLALDWSPLALLDGTARVERLSVRQIAITRLPAPGPMPTKRSTAPFRLPLTVDLRHLAVDDLALAAPIAGADAHLAATGRARLTQLDRGTLDLALRRTDRPGDYTLHAAVTAAAIDGHLTAREPARGLASMAAHLPDLGALGLEATLTGPSTGAALNLALAAGALRGDATGTLDLRNRAANLVMTIDAPAMTLAPGLAWRSVALAAKLSGPFARPAADGTIAIAGLTANGAAIGRIDGHLTADTHTAAITATAATLQLAPPNQTLLAGGPLSLQARIKLDDPAHPVTYAFQQNLLNGQGSAVLAPLPHATLSVAIPDLTVLARSRARDVAGTAGFTLRVARGSRRATRIDLDAAMDITGGADAPASARGTTMLGATVTLDGADIFLTRLALDGTTVHADATGTRRNGQMTADWHVTARDLRQLVPALRGAAAMTGHMNGVEKNFAIDAQIDGTIGTATLAPGAVSLTVHGNGLPDQPAGHVQARATLAGAPLAVDVDAVRGADQALRVAINQASWKSARLAGAVTLMPHEALPIGTLALTLPRLDDFRALAGRALSGSLTAKVDLPASGTGTLTLDARNAGLPGRAVVTRALLDARITDPTSRPFVAATLTATGLRAGAVTGDVSFTANGPRDALALKLSAALQELAGAPATIAAAATLNASAKRLTLGTLEADWHDEHFSMAAPAAITYAPGIAVDRLRLTAATLGAQPATLDLAGKLMPSLALAVTASNVTPALGKPFAPMLDADGTLRLDAVLAGTLAAPTGTLHLAAAGLRMRTGPGRALPPAALTASASLGAGGARIDATLTAGAATRLAVQGGVPLDPTGALSLRAQGALDLSVLDPILTAQGRRLRGQAALDAAIAGTAAAPAFTGNLTLVHGEVQDFAQGIHITDIAAAIAADGREVRIARFTGTAGGGTLGASGTIGLGGAMPVNLHLTAANARPINSDLVTATLDADLSVTGQARSQVTARGRIHIRRADIQVPDKLPPSVAVLNVRRPGDKPPPPAVGPGLQIPLSITLDAPQQVFVRGRGLDAELGGSLTIAGTAAAPQTSGSIELRNGSYSLAGTTLTFTSGDISFNGARKIDPALNLIATSATPDLTATLTVGGYASAPKITLSSVPDRPQDEVLAALLFHQSAASLSPFQLAQIASALAQISGIGGGGPDPIARLRKGLGLDRLSVASAPNGGAGSSTTTSVEAGRYVAPGVFVGAKQGITGAQTAAEVQIDLTRRLKLNTTAGSGTGSNSLGLTYQFQY